jgi:PIN domain nuclease of toxin-antitoxin system
MAPPARSAQPNLGATIKVARRTAAKLLPGPHRDPWDRLIVAQALGDGLTVVTADPVFRHYGLPVCW